MNHFKYRRDNYLGLKMPACFKMPTSETGHHKYKRETFRIECTPSLTYVRVKSCIYFELSQVTMSEKSRWDDRISPPCSYLSSGITVLLSLTVFMLLVAEIMPATSDSVPLIGKTTFHFSSCSFWRLLKSVHVVKVFLFIWFCLFIYSVTQ